MSTNNKISALINDQLPDFIASEAPQFASFIKGYYQWMEESGNVLDQNNQLLSYKDIDDTIDEYVDWILNEIAPSMAIDTMADRRLIAKHVIDLWQSRGSETSYRMLFRMLFGEEVEFYYPREDMLRVSDGRWLVENSLRITKGLGDLTGLGGLLITGADSGATARVVKIQATNEQGIDSTELFISNIAGTFADGELISNDDGDINGRIINTIGPLSGGTAVDGGAGYNTGDIVNVVSAGGQLGQLTVAATTDSSALTFAIANGGSGYVVGSTVDIGGVGTGASFAVDSISSIETLQISTEKIAPMLNVALNAGITFVSTGANTADVSANMAAANISSTIATSLSTTDITAGEIATISISSHGYGYDALPPVTVINANVAGQLFADGSGGIKGRNATITPSHLSGSVTSFNAIFDARGSAYNKLNPASFINTTRVVTANASGFPLVTGIVEYPGKYTDTKGWISWNNRLQDNDYYQVFSYAIRSDVAVNAYRDLVTRLLHPAGTKMFGHYIVKSNADVEPSIVSTGGGNEYQVQMHLTVAPTAASADSLINEYVLAAGTISISNSEIMGQYQWPRENLIRYSERFDVTGANNQWSMSGGTVSSNTSIAPDGTLTADTYTHTDAAPAFMFQYEIAAKANTDYILTFNAKYTANGSANVTVLPEFRDDAGAYFYSGATHTTLTSGWQKITRTVRTGAASKDLRVYLTRGSTIANGDVVAFWGAQLRAANTSDYYVATTAEPVRSYLSWPLENWHSHSAANTSTWSSTNLTLVANNVAAPSGTLTGTKYTSTGSTGARTGPLSATLPVIGQYLITGWFQPNTAPVGVSSVTFATDMVTTAGTPYLEDTADGGWFKYTLPVEVTANTGTFFVPLYYPVSNGFTSQTVGHTGVIADLQMRRANTSVEFIATTGSIITNGPNTGDFFPLTLNQLEIATADDFAARKFVRGEGTTFDSIANGTLMLVIDNWGNAANSWHYANQVSSNTTLTLSTGYGSNTLANGSFYYLANSS